MLLNISFPPLQHGDIENDGDYLTGDSTELFSQFLAGGAQGEYFPEMVV
jgi:hypothetical protein